MNLNIRKMGIGFTNKTSSATTQQAVVNNIQTEKQNSPVILSGNQPQGDIFAMVLKPKIVKKTPVTQPQIVKATKQDLAGISPKKEKKLLKELKERALNGELELPKKEDIDVIMAMPIDNGIKKDLHDLLADPERCKDSERYNKEVQVILNKHGII